MAAYMFVNTLKLSNKFKLNSRIICQANSFKHIYNNSLFDNLPRTIHNSSNREQFNENRSRINYGVAGLSFTSLLFGIYLVQNENRNYLKRQFSAFFPRVNAAKAFDCDTNYGTSDSSGSGGSEDDKRPPTQRFNFIADVVDKTSPAVVYIEIKGNHPWHGQNITLSNGSGFIVAADGLIVTNAHVVASGNGVSVKLQDGRTFNGIVDCIDHVSDLATVRINCDKLPTLELGESSKLRPGEWVVAMGSPLSLSNTITSGIISAVNRESKELGLQKDMDYIQTDAAINFGNSGGPLLNLDGKVIGINTMKVTAGISFAIPIDFVKQFLQKSKVHNSVSRGWFGKSSTKPKKRYMGITMLTLTPRIIQEMQQFRPDFPNVSSGVLVWKIVDGSPAFIAGIRPGDVVTHINDQQIKTSAEIYKVLESSEGQLKFTFLRNKKNLTTNVLPIEVH